MEYSADLEVENESTTVFSDASSPHKLFVHIPISIFKLYLHRILLASLRSRDDPVHSIMLFFQKSDKTVVCVVVVVVVAVFVVVVVIAVFCCCCKLADLCTLCRCIPSSLRCCSQVTSKGRKVPLALTSPPSTSSLTPSPTALQLRSAKKKKSLELKISFLHRMR